MITIRSNLKLIFLILIVLVIAVTCYVVVDHLVNYKTWGENKGYFLDNYYGWKVTCDINYFSEPSNCRIIDDNGQAVPNDIIIAQKDICYFIHETGKITPCVGLS